jgi:hypothetical protein
MNLALNIEPDADQDGYGDETQDACPTDPSTQAACPDKPDKTAPVISAFTSSQARFRVSRNGAVISKHAAVGTTVGVSLSETSTVNFTVVRQSSGRLVGGTCKPATHTNHAAKKCVRSIATKSFTRSLPVGASSFAFSGRYALAGKDVSLKPGRYKMTGVATDAAGNKSAPNSLSFQIVK